MYKNRHLFLNTLGLALIAIFLIRYQSWASPVKNEVPPTPGASNHVISYQGTLTNELGQPIQEIIPMTFRLYDSVDARAPVWTETYSETNAILVENGQFQVWLGSSMPFPTELWNASTLYLGIQIDTDEEMQPRERLGAAPFALQADNVRTPPDLQPDSLPDRSIGSAKLAIQQQMQRFDPTLEISATASISEGMGVEIPQTEMIITLDRASRILYMAQAGAMFSNPTSNNSIQVTVDGLPVHLYQAFGQSPTALNIFTYLDLTAGDHRITLNYFASEPESQIQIQNTPNPGFVSYLVVDQQGS